MKELAIHFVCSDHQLETYLSTAVQIPHEIYFGYDEGHLLDS